jgi:hypothetical protein
MFIKTHHATIKTVFNNQRRRLDGWRMTTSAKRLHPLHQLTRDGGTYTEYELAIWWHYHLHVANTRQPLQNIFFCPVATHEHVSS